jgi:hypothetical protein
MKPRENPAVSAAAVWAFEAAALCRPERRIEWVRSAAMVASAAKATDAPIWRLVLRTPEASPASVCATPAVAANASGVRASPMPKVARSAPPNTEPQYEPVGPACESHSRPDALARIPTMSGTRGP